MQHLGLAMERKMLSEPMRSPHQHFDLELNFVLSGELLLYCGEDHVTLRAGEAALFWAACLHRITWVQPTTEFVWVTFGLDAFLQWNLPKSASRAVLDGQILVDSTPGEQTGDRAALARWEGDYGASGDVDATELFAQELACRVRRLCRAASLERAQGPGVASTRTADALPENIERMARLVVQQHQEPITVDQVARAVGLHRNYATAAFRRHFGISLKEHITRQRVMTAQRLLATTDDTVQAIAFASGFQTASRFYEAFRNRTGASPQEYRGRVRGGG